MKQKVISNVFLGLKGIFCNQTLNTYQKIILYYDDFRFLLLLILVYFFKKEIHRVKIESFGYIVYFENFVTFYYIFNEIFCKGVYAPIKMNNYFDLGANIGLSVLWYKFFNPDLSITAFEPDKNNYTYLLKNIRANHLKGIHTYRVALTSKKGNARFYTIIDDVQNLDSGLTLNQKLPYKSYVVKTDMLSNRIRTMIDLVKIDIEGAEYEVFDDLFKTRKIRFIKNLMFEAHFFNTKQKEKLKKITSGLKRIGNVDQLKNSNFTTVFSFHSKPLS